VGVPALRQHREDIPDLAHSMLREAGTPLPVSRRAMVALTSYSWPGNVTQLRRVLRDAARLSGGGEIRPEHLGPEICATSRRPRSLTRLETVERDAIVQALRECDGNRVRAATLLGISRSTLYRRLREFGLEPSRTILLAAAGHGGGPGERPIYTRRCGGVSSPDSSAPAPGPSVATTAGQRCRTAMREMTHACAHRSPHRDNPGRLARGPVREARADPRGGAR
jgi:hypothetical protein